uniref:DIOX_N domain-containing protein n=1 Tax=Heterorhabditis bacteriophora TaxID=37862 RepID=A0A1I7W6J8_HETBA
MNAPEDVDFYLTLFKSAMYFFPTVSGDPSLWPELLRKQNPEIINKFIFSSDPVGTHLSHAVHSPKSVSAPHAPYPRTSHQTTTAIYEGGGPIVGRRLHEPTMHIPPLVENP